MSTVHCRADNVCAGITARFQKKTVSSKLCPEQREELTKATQTISRLSSDALHLGVNGKQSPARSGGQLQACGCAGHVQPPLRLRGKPEPSVLEW